MRDKKELLSAKEKRLADSIKKAEKLEADKVKNAEFREKVLIELREGNLTNNIRTLFIQANNAPNNYHIQNRIWIALSEFLTTNPTALDRPAHAQRIVNKQVSGSIKVIT